MQDDKVKCHICGGFGYVDNGKDGRMRRCECLEKEIYEKRFKRANLTKLFEKCTFDNYKEYDENTKNAKNIAINFVDDKNAKVVIFSGQVGSGKTHLAVAILSTLLKDYKNCLYVNYKDLVRVLSQTAMDKDKYDAYINNLIKCDVLLIDDLFKCRDIKEITNAQLNYIYEIVNSRYIENSKIIITTEKSISELLQIDEAIGSRLFEMATKNNIADMRNIKNHRLRAS